MNWIEYRINEAREKELPELDLSTSPRFGQREDSLDTLTELPEAILDLTHLTKLDLGGHDLKELPREIYKLENLGELSVAFNRNIVLPKELDQLPN